LKISCEIVKDLLPLYHDNVCSSESRALIEEHLDECQSCADLLNSISDELAHPVNVIDETKPLKAFQAIVKKIKIKSLLIGVVISFIAFLVIITIISFLTQPRWTVPIELIEVTDVAQLSDGRITFTLAIDGDRDLYRFGWTVSGDGSCYYRVTRTLFGRSNSYDLLQSGELNLRNTEGTAQLHMPGLRYVVDIAALNATEQSRSSGIAITSFYIGTRNNAVLVWEEGMELPVAEADWRYDITIPHR